MHYVCLGDAVPGVQSTANLEMVPYIFGLFLPFEENRAISVSSALRSSGLGDRRVHYVRLIDAVLGVQSAAYSEIPYIWTVSCAITAL